MEKKIVMIDQDEVICEGGFLHAINEFLGTNYIKEDFKDFYMQEVIPENLRRTFFYEFLIKQNLYDSKYCVLMPHAQETISNLDLSGEYMPFITTDYIVPEIKFECGYNLENKFKFLVINHILEPYRYIFTGDKKIIAAHIRIDDKLHNLINAIFKPKMRLMYTAYHNTTLTDEYLKSYETERVNEWPDIGRKLLR